MSRRNKLEKKYIELKNQTAPDLWNRIEAGLEPKSCVCDASVTEKKRKNPRYLKPVAVLASLAVIGFSVHLFSVTQRTMTAGTEKAGGAAETTAAAGAMVQAEEKAVVSERKTEARFVSYEALSLTPTAPQIILPQAAYGENTNVYDVDAAYFSEDILAETQLFCQAEVLGVSYETDSDGTACAVNYEVVIGRILYAEDYIGAQETIVVKSPITEAATAGPLYALQKHRTYLLPLKKQGGDYRLVFPFAPQIEVTLDNEYIFHNGWQSLLNDDAYVVLNSPAGPQDYYYDRMFLRKDADTLADLTAITEEKHQNRSSQNGRNQDEETQ